MPLTIAITDDHPMMRKAMQAALTLSSGTEIIFSCANGNELLQQLKKQQPEILLLDIRLPDIDGIELCKIIKTQYPSIKIIIITNHDDSWYINQLLQLGVHGYLLKDTGFNILEEAIHTVQSDAPFLDPRIRPQSAPAVEIPFTRKEKEILHLLASGQTLQQMADQLKSPLRITEMHYFNLIQKLGKENYSELLQEARRRGLI